MESEDEMHVRHPAFLKFDRITIRDHSPIELSVDDISEKLLLLLLEDIVRQERVVLPRLARQQVLLRIPFFSFLLFSSSNLDLLPLGITSKGNEEVGCSSLK